VTVGDACQGKYLKVAETPRGTSYCTHPKAKAYTCEYHCSHDICPFMDGVEPKSEPKAEKEGK
jgi:hypothetical protein